MNAQLFVYTRTKNVDYQVLISPTEDLCPKSTRKHFLSQARGTINVELYDDPFTEPRWLLSRKGNLLLWGIGIQNKDLNEDFYKDFTGRPVRGFFGIVLNLSEQEAALPFDLSFFRKIYLTYIVPIWDVEFDALKKSSVGFDFDITTFNCIRKESAPVKLNHDIDKTLILGKVDLNDTFATALSSCNDISVVSGFSSKSHAFAHEYLYTNAVVIGIEEPETKNHKKTIPPVQPPIYPPAEPKKALRLKLIIGTMIVLCIASVILHKCTDQEYNKSQEGLVSGVQKDSIQKKK